MTTQLTMLGEEEGGRIALAPAGAVTLFRAHLPDLAPAQARAAARLIAAERSATPVGALHVATGEADESGMRWVALCDVETMAAWAAQTGDTAIVPAPLLVPSPFAGFCRAAVGDEMILRGSDVATLDDPAMTPLLVGDAAIAALDDASVEDAIDRALAAPPLDLRQGPFAPRRRWQPEGKALRRLAILGGALALVSLAVPLVQVVRLNRDAGRLEADARALEQNALGGESADARLAALRGPGGGFAPGLRIVRAAVQATPNAQLTTVSFEADGSLSINLQAASPADLDAVRARIAAAGLGLTPGAITGGAMPSQQIGVRGR